MSTFNKSGPLQTNLELKARVEEEGTGKFVHILKKDSASEKNYGTHTCEGNTKPFGTGISRSQRENMALSYVIGMVTFFDTPSVYKRGSIVECKVSDCPYIIERSTAQVMYILSFSNAYCYPSNR